jgi:hypothetical protein
MPMETQSEALQRLTAAGYIDDYRAESLGLRGRADADVRPPESFLVDEIVRFEGESDPSEESIVFALTSQVDGSRGTYTVAFGPVMDPLDAVMVGRFGA